MKFADIIKSPEAEGKEKHVPVIEIDRCQSCDEDAVRVIVGKEVSHPNTVEHHIAWVELFGVKKNGQVVCLGRADFAPSYASPNARWHVTLAEFKAFGALSYCNIHGLWANYLEI